MNTLRLYFGILRDSLLDFRKLFVFHTLTVTEVRHDKDDILTVVCTSNKPLDYKPGQYGIWFLNRWVSGKPGRLFSVASAPEEGVIQLSTRNGRTDFKRKLQRIAVGDKMYMEGPIGQFVLPEKPPIDVVFVAGGIGITPIRAMAKHIQMKSLPIDTTLIYSSAGSYLYESELKQAVKATTLVTRETLPEALTSIASRKPNATYYISGPPAFVESARKQLRKRGVSSIKTDAFLGY